MSDFQSEAALIQEGSSQTPSIHRLVYRGPSMTPTFRPGQILHLNAEAHEILPGDVIVFRNRNGIGYVVHRIISISKGGFITRGDNNLRTDPNPILPEQIIGQVEKANHGGQLRMVAGGWHGLWKARVFHMVLHVKRFLRRGLSRPYRWLKHSGIVAKLWHPDIERIYFETQDGPLLKYTHNGRTVAYCWQNSGRWWFRRPYDFVIGQKLKKKTTLHNS